MSYNEIRFKNLFENAVEYIFLIDSDHRVIDANKAALKLFGLEIKDKLIGMNIIQYISPRIFENTKYENISLEVEFSIPELEKQCYCILNISVVDAEKDIYQLVLHDITERRVIEQREKMLEKQALTGKVARVIAHEIKNPLTNIHLSLAELRTILKGAKLENSNEDPDEFLNIIERNGKRINTLIEDLLNATRFDMINTHDFYVHELLEETYSHVQDRVKLKGIQVERSIEDKLLVKGDKEKLAIALLNILVNAVEAVEEREGKLKILTSYFNGIVSIVIADNGKGIPKESQARLFEPFFTSKKGGSGLGLTAAYNIVAKHDGTIKVTSKMGEYTTFLITLPARSVN